MKDRKQNTWKKGKVDQPQINILNIITIVAVVLIAVCLAVLLWPEEKEPPGPTETAESIDVEPTVTSTNESMQKPTEHQHSWKAATYDAPETSTICGTTRGQTLKKPKKGDIITFGTYEQDGNESNGKEPIEWQILDVQGDRALIISCHCLDRKKYHLEYGGTNWKDCSLRYWLNEDFLQEAFTGNEQKSIATTSVDNSASQGNSIWKLKNGDTTEDKIFLLSYQETETYFGSDESRICKPTKYVIKHDDSKQGVASNDTGAGWWWLRSPGVDGRQAAIVNHKGKITSQTVANDYLSVRPVLWMKLG